MRQGKFLKRMTVARQRLKDRLYARFGALLRGEPEAEGQPRTFGLFERLIELEQEDGPGSLERLLNRLPDGLGQQIATELRRILDERADPEGTERQKD